MKTYISILTFTLILFLGSCCDNANKTNCTEDKEAIENLLEKYIMGNENQNFDIMEEIWSPDDDIILYGTDNDERLVGWLEIRDAIKEQFNNITDTYISASNQVIKFNCTGNTAWFCRKLEL